MHMWLIAPITVTSSVPLASSTCLRSVPRNALIRFFTITGSSPAGATLEWICAPSLPGAKNGASGPGNSWRTWTDLSPFARERYGVVYGKGYEDRVDFGGSRRIEKKKQLEHETSQGK